jgi:activator of HSP90 ATPase
MTPAPHRNPRQKREHNMESQFSRSAFTVALGGLVAGVSAVAVPRAAIAQADGEIFHSADAIRQVVDFDASPDRVYRALTTDEFDHVVQLSAARAQMALGTTPTQIRPDPGTAFALFGGYITGRVIELVPTSRIVQAWRSGSWDAGFYSIARYDITPRGSGTRLTFTQGGFPAGEGPTLVKGWHLNYWQPLMKYLA